MNSTKKTLLRKARARRTHAVTRASGRNRLVVYRSNKTVYAQIVNDETGKIVCGTSGLKLKSTGMKAAEEIGKTIAELAKKSKIKEVAFDRNGYKYHGQVKSLAESARAAGLKF